MQRFQLFMAIGLHGLTRIDTFADGTKCFKENALTRKRIIYFCYFSDGFQTYFELICGLKKDNYTLRNCLPLSIECSFYEILRQLIFTLKFKKPKGLMSVCGNIDLVEGCQICNNTVSLCM